MFFVAHRSARMFKTLLVLCLLSLVACVAQANSRNLNFLGEVDRKLRVLIVGAPVGFNMALAKLDDGTLFDWENSPTGMDDSDLALIFMNSWESAQYLDDSWNHEVVDSLLSAPSDEVLKIFTERIGAENKLHMFAFYNKTHTEKMETKCIAQDVINFLTLSKEEYMKVHVSMCIKIAT